MQFGRGRERGKEGGGRGGGGQDVELMQFGTLKIMLAQQLRAETELAQANTRTHTHTRHGL